MVSRYMSLVAAAALSAIVVQPAAAQTPPASPKPPQTTQTPAPWPPPGVERAGKGIQHPVVVKESKPNYTREAMKAGIQGSVELEAVVTTEGRVGEVRVIRSLDKDLGLDDEAVKALKDWEFKPATKNGVAVPVVVTIELTFCLRKQ